MNVRRRHFGFGALADDEQLALQLVLRHALRPAYENLLDIRLRAARDAADGVRIDRRVAPSENRQSFFARDALDNAFDQQPVARLDGQKDHADAILARGRQRETELGALPREKSVRDLNENAGAVARLGIATAGAAMRQIDEDLQALKDNVVRLFARNVDHESDPAGIVLVRGIV